MLNKRVILAALMAGLALTSGLASADAKIGFVNTDRVFREAAPAVKAQKNLEAEFAPREQELQQLSKQAQALQSKLEKEGTGMSATERQNKERDLANLNRDFQRRQREFREDLNLKRNEAMAMVQDKANRAIQAIAKAEKYDLILQEAVYFSPEIDITNKVLKALAAGN
jgi:outer membrane protein